MCRLSNHPDLVGILPILLENPESRQTLPCGQWLHFRCVSWRAKYGEYMFVGALVCDYLYLFGLQLLWPSASMESTNGSYAFRLCQSSERNFGAHWLQRKISFSSLLEYSKHPHTRTCLAKQNQAVVICGLQWIMINILTKEFDFEIANIDITRKYCTKL